MPTRFVPDPDAFDVLSVEAAPAIMETAEALTGPIMGNVPVVDGVLIGTYHPAAVATPTGARWYPGSPMWHWIEYGTRFNAPYRPIQNGIASLGLRFEPS